MYQLLLKEEPISLNNAGNGKKEEFKKFIRGILDEKYGLKGQKAPYDRSKRCYILVVYIYKRRKQRDLDNIVKYIQDAFSKKLFKDDSQVYFCLSEGIPCDTSIGISMLDMTLLESEIAADIYDFYNGVYDKDHLSVTYIECGEMNDNFYKIGLETIWK